MRLREMISTLGITAIGLLIIIGIAYHGEKEGEIKKEQGNQITNSWEVMTYIDPETGVNYLIFDHYGKAGAAVRVDQDGKPIVSRKDN